MEYPVKVEISDKVDDVSRKRIEDSLKDGVLCCPTFPQIGMPLNLKSGIRITMINVIPNQSMTLEYNEVADVVVRPFLPKDSEAID